MTRRSRFVPPEWLAALDARAAEHIVESELLYLTTDPGETPLVMPTWARSVPELAAAIDEGHRRRAQFPYTDAERKLLRP
jgi:hypothetical protein